MYVNLNLKHRDQMSCISEHFTIASFITTKMSALRYATRSHFYLLVLLTCRCDVCINGPPEMQNLKAEAEIFMQAIAAQNASTIDICTFSISSYYVN